MWPFSCKVCLEKDKRIADLKETILHQRQILNPPPRVNRYEIEEDFLMNGGNAEELPQPNTINAEAQAKIDEMQAAVQLEREMMLGGDTIEYPAR